jgi:hypothetical protein
MNRIKYPITVNKITYDHEETVRDSFMCKTGSLVRVRPCDKEYEGKTFLGIFLGEVALSQIVSYREATQELVVSKMLHNPMIFIPDLNRIVYGCGSWWGRIRSENDLKAITDLDIQNQWYVKALRQIADLESEEAK